MPVNSEIVVVGSHVYGSYISCERLPKPGETVSGHSFDPCVLDDGGKGSNQAFCAARLGARTTFLGAIGTDPQGHEGMRVLAREGCDVSRVRHEAGTPTGVSVAILDRDGLSVIVTDPGANARLTPPVLDSLSDTIAGHQWCLVQFELPLASALHATRVAARRGVRTMLTPGPMQTLEPGDLAGLDVLIPNETEAAALLDQAGLDGDVGEAARTIAERWQVANVILTHGHHGVTAYWEGRLVEVPAFRVEARNTIGAGDAFAAATATALCRGAAIEDALRFASAVAALAVSHPGAPWASYPRRDQVGVFLAEAGYGALAGRVLGNG